MFDHLHKLIPQIAFGARPRACIKLTPTHKLSSIGLRQAYDEVRAALTYVLLSGSDGEATASGIELRELIVAARNAVGVLDCLIGKAQEKVASDGFGNVNYLVSIPWEEWQRLSSVRNNLYDAATQPPWTQALVPRLGRGP